MRPPNPPAGAGTGRGRSTRWGRSRRPLIAGLSALLTLALIAVFGIGWYFSGLAIAVGDHRPDYGATLRAAVSLSSVELSRQHESELPGRYGLEWAGGYGQVGAITATSASTVTRAFTRLGGQAAPPAGTAVGLDPDFWAGDPGSALGLAYQQVAVRSELGDLPTWYVPGDRTDRPWAVFVHGHDGDRTESLRYLTFLHGRGIPVLVPSYRNDPGAPPSPDHQDHLGGTEWRDVEATVRWALDHGASGVVLFGWSMGAAVSLQLVDRSPLRADVRGLVLDSPVLDWRDVLDHQGDLRNLPRPLTAVAIRLVEARLGMDLGRFDWVARAGELTRPMFVVHGPDDDYVPDGPTLRLAAARPDLVTYLDVPGADHTRGWNVDPNRYQGALGSWLAGHGL